MKRLIVNADDFGLTAGVNTAVVELNRDSLLSSATLMANSSASKDAVKLALATPSLGVGCHVVLLDGEPVLPAKRLPSLIETGSQRFAPSLVPFLRRLMFRGGAIEAEIEAETTAQIELLQGYGLKPTHIDTHKHTHMFPRVLRSVLRGASAAGIRAIRNPFEPEWSLRATPGAPWIRRTQVNLLRNLEANFRKIVADEGFQTTDGAIGVLATGTLNSHTLNSLLDAMPQGTWELVTHPGYSDQALAMAGTRLIASREVERQVLMSRSLPADVQLIHFGQLGGTRETWVQRSAPTT